MAARVGRRRRRAHLLEALAYKLERAVRLERVLAEQRRDQHGHLRRQPATLHRARVSGRRHRERIPEIIRSAEARTGGKAECVRTHSVVKTTKMTYSASTAVSAIVAMGCSAAHVGSTDEDAPAAASTAATPDRNAADSAAAI